MSSGQLTPYGSKVEKVRQRVRVEHIKQESNRVEPDWDKATEELGAALVNQKRQARRRWGLTRADVATVNAFLRCGPSRAEAEVFANRYPRFLPRLMWEKPVEEVIPRPAPVAPDTHTPTIETPTMQTPPATYTPMWRAWRELLIAAWHRGFDRDVVKELLRMELPEGHPFRMLPALELGKETLAPSKDEVKFGYQDAVLGLFA